VKLKPAIRPAQVKLARSIAFSVAVIAAVAALVSCAAQAPLSGEEHAAVIDRTVAAGAAVETGQGRRTEAAEGPLNIRVSDAVLLALENNPQLAVETLSVPITATFEDEEAAEFDPVLSAGASHERVRYERFARAASGTETALTETNSGDAALSTFFPTGTEVALEASIDQTTSSLSDARLDTARLGLSVTQALLRGAGTGVNLASVRQARLDTLISEYELRGFTEALVAEVETTYWDYVLALREIDIFEESRRIAGQALNEIEERIRIGTLAEIELAAGQAEVALRREALIRARGNLATTRLRLLQLLNPPREDMWDLEIRALDEPSAPSDSLDEVADHVALALKLRPELNEARLALSRDELELVKTRNGLLPRMDLFLNLGKTSYAESFGSALGDIDEDDTYDVFAGVSLEYPLKNRAAAARHERAGLERARSQEAFVNLTRLVELDVRAAHIKVDLAGEQVAATAATRRLQEETVRGEVEKFRVGKSTTFLVAQAQRDLVVGQIGEVRALANYQKALVDLYRLDGSLLLRRGVAAPGSQPR
jgi:outer membrane protein TolC